MRNRRGQAALVMMLLFAIGLVFFAATLNWSRIAQTKTQTLISANSGVMATASIMASDAEAKWRQYLHGRHDKNNRPSFCENTNFWILLTAIIIATVAVILAVPIGGATLVLAVIALAIAVGSMTLNQFVIQPGLTTMWNRLQRNLEPESFFLETGITTAVQMTVNDNAQVPDLGDMDSDGKIYGNMGGDWINRWGFYYSQRLLMLQPSPLKSIQTFVNELNVFTNGDDSRFNPKEKTRCGDLKTLQGVIRKSYFIEQVGANAESILKVLINKQILIEEPTVDEYTINHTINISNDDIAKIAGDDTQKVVNILASSYYDLSGMFPFNAYGCTWQLNDSPCTDPNDARCNVCCTPEFAKTPNPFKNNLPECRNHNLGLVACSSDYIYKRVRPQSCRAFQSRVDMGFQNADYREVYTNTAPPLECAGKSNPYGQGTGDSYGSEFPYVYNPNNQNYADRSQFSFLKFIGQDAVSSDVDPGFGNPSKINPMYPGLYNFKATDALVPVVRGDLYEFLWNMRDRLAPLKEDNTNIIVDGNGQVLDNVTPIENFAVKDNTAMPDLDPVAHQFKQPWWKAKTDGFCKPVTKVVFRGQPSEETPGWPYETTCDQKRIDQDGNPIAERWHDDVIDNFAKEGQELIKFSKSLKGASIEDLRKGFADWYPSAADWIAPKCQTPEFCKSVDDKGQKLHDQDLACTAACSPDREGRLRTWRNVLAGDGGDKEGKPLGGVLKVIDDWLLQDVASPNGTKTFCDPANAAGMSTFEKSLYKVEGNGSIKSSKYNVAQCLLYYKESAKTTLDNCAKACSVERCTQLPRSLLQSFSTNDPKWARQMPHLTDIDTTTNKSLDQLYGERDNLKNDAAALKDVEDAIARIYTATNATSCALDSEFMKGIQQSSAMFEKNNAVITRRANIVADTVLRAIGAREELARAYVAIDAFLGPRPLCETLHGNAYDKCAEFPAYSLMRDRANYRPDGADSNNVMIYGWKGDQGATIQGAPSGNNKKNYWHMVRVELKIPKRCPDPSKGNRNGKELCLTDTLPRLDTKVYPNMIFPVMRCYILEGYPGMALMRVTRWDEDRDQSSGTRFMNKVRLWNFSTANPGKKAATKNDPTVSDLVNTCAGKVEQINPQGPWSPDQVPIGVTKGAWAALLGINIDNTVREKFRDAFMVNLLQGKQGADKEQNKNKGSFNKGVDFKREMKCLKLADEFLKRGVSTTTCAMYYLKRDKYNIPERMAVKFVECPKDAFSSDQTDFMPVKD